MKSDLIITIFFIYFSFSLAKGIIIFFFIVQVVRLFTDSDFIIKNFDKYSSEPVLEILVVIPPKIKLIQ
ncbi:MAG: hypothetical protein Kow0042_26900 [Calditrichia bacterium]